MFINKIPSKYVNELLFPDQKKESNIKIFLLKKSRIKSTIINKRLMLSNNNSRKSISLIEESKVNIPNKLKKYLNERPLPKSYIRKLSILLNSNDKYYRFKRPILKELSSAFDENNNEYLSIAKYNDYFGDREEYESSSTSREIVKNNNKKLLKNSISNIHKKNSGLNKNDFLEKIPAFLKENLESYRTPEVIINNEKLMFDVFKRKKLISKMPYLSRNRNDLIIFDRRTKNNSYNRNLENFNNNINHNANFLKKQNTSKLCIKKIQINSKNKYAKNKISSPSFHLNNHNKKIIGRNILLPFIKNNSKSIIFEKNNKYK